MWLLVLGLVVFLGTHLISSLPKKRLRLMHRFTQGGFKKLYSLAAIAGLLMIIVGFGLARREGWGDGYTPLPWLKYPASFLILVSLILFAANKGKSYISWYVRHPLISAVGLWSFAHLLVNGDWPSILLFGSFLAWAIFARFSMSKREALGLLKTRDFEPIAKVDLVSLVAGCGIGLLFIMFLHQLLIGVPVI